MKKIFLLTFFAVILSTNVFSLDKVTQIKKTDSVPWLITYDHFEKLIAESDASGDSTIIKDSYFANPAAKLYVLKPGLSRIKLESLYSTLSGYETGISLIDYESKKVVYEKNNPVFLQKGGMLRPLSHSFYFRTDDEWTGFSTIFLGYRFAPNEYFNFSIEGGVGLPQLYMANILLHFKLFETENRIFFLGLRARFGYKYQHTEDFMNIRDKDGVNLGYLGFGDKYLTIQDKHSLYFATDLTAAIRFGRLQAQSVYYTIFPKVDFNLRTGDADVLFSPVMIGYEVRFGRYMEWSFAVEGGYAFPLPWGSIPDGEWINFPSLANVSVNYFIPYSGNSMYNKLK